MNKIFLLLGCLALVAIWYFYPKAPHEKLIKVGMVLPIQHVALDDIVQGFKSELEAKMGPGKVTVEVQNALGDINLQKSAINKFLNDHVDLLVPVATGVAQMAINLAPKEQPVLFLAAKIPPDSPSAQAKPGLMGVVDEIPVETQFKFIHAALPELKKIALIFSSNDKQPSDAADFAKACEAEGVVAQKLMIQNLSELYTVAAQVQNDAQAIFIFKDSMVASGIAALVQQADKLGIPLITSDEGTNSQGGAFAVGVVEADIGRQGARMAAAYLQKAFEGPAIQFLDKISLFVNTKACELQNVSLEALIRAAAAQNLEVIKR